MLATTASNASFPTSMMPEAVAIRVVAALSPTSTIFGLFCSSKCVKFTNISYLLVYICHFNIIYDVNKVFMTEKELN